MVLADEWEDAQMKITLEAERKRLQKEKDCLEGITPCCNRRNEYNGFGSGKLKFVCPLHCSCHD